MIDLEGHNNAKWLPTVGFPEVPLSPLFWQRLLYIRDGLYEFIQLVFFPSAISEAKIIIGRNEMHHCLCPRGLIAGIVI